MAAGSGPTRTSARPSTLSTISNITAILTAILLALPTASSSTKTEVDRPGHQVIDGSARVVSIYGNHMGDGTHVVHQVLPSPSTPTSWFSFSLADDEAILHDSAEESSAPDLGAIDYAGSADTATRFNVVACGARSSSTSPISSPPFCRRSGSDASAAVTRENRATPRSRDAARDGGPLPSGLGSLPAAAATAIVIVVMVVTYLLATQPSTASAQPTARPAAQSAAQIEAQRRFGGQGVHSSGGACVEHVW